jgi:DNA-binding GntR family transcriptional regulator
MTTDYPLTSTPEQIAAALRAQILKGELKSAQPLRQDELAARFGVSKIPVREALVQLKAEGLVNLHPNRGAVVSELSAAEADEIYVMRMALEAAALRRAIPQLTVAQLQQAEAVLDELDHEADPARWGELNWAFHAVLYAPAAMPRLLETIHTLHVNVARYLILYLVHMDYQHVSQQEHRAILEACRFGKTEQALALLEAHLQTAAQHMTAFLQQQH